MSLTQTRITDYQKTTLSHFGGLEVVDYSKASLAVFMDDSSGTTYKDLQNVLRGMRGRVYTGLTLRGQKRFGFIVPKKKYGKKLQRWIGSQQTSAAHAFSTVW